MKLFICAMEEELSETIKLYNLTAHEVTNVYTLYQYNDNLFVHSAIGQVNSAIALTMLLNKYFITAIYNLGAVGSLKSNLKILDIVYVKTATYLFADARHFNYQMGQIPREKVNYHSSPLLLEKVNKIIPLLPGVVLGTSDIFVNEQKYFDHIQESFRNEIDIVDMEGTAFFHTADKFDVPIVSIKIISDYFNTFESSEQQFANNLHSVGIIIKDIITKLISI